MKNKKNMFHIINNHSVNSAIALLSKEIFNYPYQIGDKAKINIGNDTYSFLFESEQIIFSKHNRKKELRRILIKKNLHKSFDLATQKQKIDKAFNLIENKNIIFKKEELKNAYVKKDNIIKNRKKILNGKTIQCIQQRMFLVKLLGWDKPFTKKLGLYDTYSNINNFLKKVLSSNKLTTDLLDIYIKHLKISFKNDFIYSISKKSSYLY